MTSDVHAILNIHFYSKSSSHDRILALFGYLGLTQNNTL